LGGTILPEDLAFYVAAPGQPLQPRARGSLHLSCHKADGVTRIEALRHSGSLKVLFPASRSEMMSAVLLNTAGGITGGDEFSIQITAQPRCAVTLTSQAAERAYRAQPGETGKVSVNLCAQSGAHLAWLPQETLLYDGSLLRRQLDAQVAGDAGLLLVEPIVFGRIAMGEVLNETRFEDHWRIRRDGELVLADAVRLDGVIQRQLENSAVAKGARAMATVLLVAPNAEAILPRLQALLDETGGASLIRPGVLLARLLAPDSFLLRRTLIPVMRLLNQNEIPKNWVL